MSTYYDTTPPILYETFRANLPDGFEVVVRPPGYSVPHVSMRFGTHYAHAFQGEDGNVRFETYGASQTLAKPLFERIETRFSVKIRDEYGATLDESFGE